MWWLPDGRKLWKTQWSSLHRSILSSIKQMRINEDCEGDSVSGWGCRKQGAALYYGEKGLELERAGGNLKPSRQSLLTAKEATRHHTWNGGRAGQLEKRLWKDKGCHLDTEYRAQLLPPNYQSPAEIFYPRGLRALRTWNTWVSDKSYRLETMCRSNPWVIVKGRRGNLSPSPSNPGQSHLFLSSP